jgi:glutaredoxin 3
MANIIVYSMSNCPYCTKAKNLLSSKGIPYKEINTDGYSDAEWDELCDRSGMKTLPQIFNGDNLIGGYTELAEVDGQDGLKSLK